MMQSKQKAMTAALDNGLTDAAVEGRSLWRDARCAFSATRRPSSA
jgi:oligopeptide transport system permease protein